MAREQKIKFCLFRYVPNVVRGEFVNIGVAIYEAPSWAPDPDDWSKFKVLAKFTRDWHRVKRLDPKADTRLLSAMAIDLESRLSNDAQIIGSDGSLLTSFLDDLSNSIQVTDPQAFLAASTPTALDEVFQIYVA